MGFVDIMITILVLVGLFVIVYSKIRDQNLKDTFDEIKEVVAPVSVEPGVMP